MTLRTEERREAGAGVVSVGDEVRGADPVAARRDGGGGDGAAHGASIPGHA